MKRHISKKAVVLITPQTAMSRLWTRCEAVRYNTIKDQILRG